MPFLLLMPSFNQAHYIVDAVRSVLAQDDPDWELWILDNSTDATPEVMRQFDDPRIRFYHIAERMDPGTCLNWMLERAVGNHFSYIHTDNNLQRNYVRCMREALTGHPLGLAYCDMRTIDENGRCFQVFRRGKFDLPRLLSVDPLGVPFAASTELAKQLGGFGVRDFSDDVRFCASAYGIADYIHIPEPLMDYRNHGDSRTEQAGGVHHMQLQFVDLMPKILPLLEQRGINVLLAIEQAIRAELNNLEWFIEDLWHRRLSRYATAWWQGWPKLDNFFWVGLLPMPGFPAGQRPERKLWIRDEQGKLLASPWGMVKMRQRFKKNRYEVRRFAEQARRMLLPWACMKLGVDSNAKLTIRVGSLDVRTLWAARHIELALGWTIVTDPSLSVPTWLNWSTGSGDEPLLDCSDVITFRTINNFKAS